MTDDRFASAPALPPPMTVGRYVRDRYSSIVRRNLSYASFGIPLIVAARMVKEGFSLKLLSMGALAYVLVCLLIAALVAIVLAMSGWWKLHTKINPIIPVSIAMVLAILGYVLMVNLY